MRELVEPMETQRNATGLGRALPGLGYAVGLVACAVVEKWFIARWGETGRELTWCVLAPALFALVHVLTRRRAQGTLGFGLLAVLWGGAAVIGLVSHWQSLHGVGPMLSLLRYATIALAGCLFCVSVIVSRPLFAARSGAMPLLGRIALGVLGSAMLVAWVVVLAVATYLTPFPIALAPREQGLSYERVTTSDWRDYFVWFAWSPDSRRLVGQSGGLVVVDLAEKSRKVVWPYGIVDADRPWDADGRGFYFARPGTSSESGVWYAPLDGAGPRKIAADLTGVVSCSPDGKTLAYNGSRGITLVDSEGGRGRVLSEQGGIPIWSPDGKHLLVMSQRDHTREVFLVSMDGATRRLWGPPADASRVAWVSSTRFATLTISQALPSSPDLRVAEVVVWDLEGNPIRHYSLGRYKGGSTGGLAATRDGRRLAVGLDIELTLGSSLMMLDLKTGRLTRLPAPDYSAGPLAWSPDGRSLAISDIVEEEHEHGYSYVAVISGFKLFKKEEPW
jgi:hypothetical protein